MGKTWILSCCLLLLVCINVCDSEEQLPNSHVISSVAYPSTPLGPYDWRYIRVDLPPWFSSLSLALETDVDLNLNEFKKTPVGSLAIICFRDGSLPLPDIHNTSEMGLVMDYISNDSFVGNQSLQNFEKCYPLQKNIFLRVTNEQIFPGTWYFGIFNGVGPLRTQSKMLERGHSLLFSANISVEGCSSSMMSGKFCNQTVSMLSCNANYNLTGIGIKNETYRANGRNVIACGNANGISCHENAKPKVYLFDAENIGEEILISAANLTFSQAQNSIITVSHSLLCYARYGAMPLETVYDFSGDISWAPLVLQFPKAGRWYIIVQSIDSSTKSLGMQSNISRVCYMLEWQVLQCPMGKAGLKCTSERHMLEAVIQKDQFLPFESNYLPITRNASSLDSAFFHLEPLLSSFSHGDSHNGSWTFFILDIPSGSALGNIHLHLTSNLMQNYEIYARYGGLPSLTSWDYFYATRTNSNNGSTYLKIYESTEDTVSFYILYARVGTWYFGIRQLNPTDASSNTAISLSIESCPNKCSSFGRCLSRLDAGGLILYSYCHCDLDHGGFDCSVEIVSHKWQIVHSIFLVASNAASLFPAFWALRNKAFAEWILFTCSGTASAVYHACDSGAGCLLGFHTLQFLDFWLSFMAVVSTFIYLTTMSEASKRTIHTLVAVLTALMAQTDPTRSKNISIVMGLGALGLLIGWLVEFWTHQKSTTVPREDRWDLLRRWNIFKGWIHNIFKTIKKRYVGAGFLTLALAVVSWQMESFETYWIWHSLWHITIYTSSFFFLCAKPSTETAEATTPANYELTRQASFNENEVRRE
ncbi:uncharacterized protein LOC127262553 [Andrographis paniculata]|uniref:uncharacterized protein LOC127262553 n=1 Tax=Andrographis paniculata TaxID=175694 RepID=UPI0021E7965E|nr:uncharacterized protein LOC127262553 [Andrographis paniculata]